MLETARGEGGHSAVLKFWPLPVSPSPQVKAAGKYRQEGKTYVVVDGDIIHFQVRRMNV